MPPFLLGALGSTISSGGGLVTLLSRFTSLLPVLNLLSAPLLRLVIGFTALRTAVGLVSSTASKAVGELKNLGSAIIDLRAATGLSVGGSSRLINAYSAAGMSPSAAGAMLGGMNPLEMQMRARLFGVAPGNVAGMAASYQRMNPLMRNAMLGPMDSPEMRRVLMQDPAAIRANQAFGNRVRGGLGLSPETFSRVSQQLEIVTTKFRILGESVLVKLASTILPRVIRVLDYVADRIGDRSQAIGEGIESGVNKGFEALIKVGELITRLPEIFFGLADSVLNFAQTAIGAIPQVWDIFLTGVDYAQAGLTSLAQVTETGFLRLLVLAQTLDSSFLQLVSRVQFVADNAAQPLERLGDAISNFVQKIFKSIGAGAGLLGGDPYDAPQQAGRTGWIGRAWSTVTKPIRAGAEMGLRALGFGPEVSATGGMVAPGVVGGLTAKWGWRALLKRLGIGAAARGVAGAGTRGAVGAGLLSNPIGWTILGGAALGIGGYELFRKNGIGMAKGLPSTWQMLEYATGTGAFAPSQPGSPDPLDDVKKAARDVKKSVSGSWQMPIDRVPLGSWSQGLQNIGRGGIGFSLPRLKLPRVERGSWASALDAHVGGSIGLQAQAQTGINALRADLDKARANYNGDEIRRTLRDLLSENKEQTRLQRGIKEDGGFSSDKMDRVAGYMLYRYAKESSAALRRHGA